MGQRPSAKSVGNFVIFLLILQNCDGARIQQSHQQAGGRDGLAKFEFSAHSAGRVEAEAEAEEALHVFNFAKIYKTLYGYARLPPAEGRAARKPFLVLAQLQQDLAERMKRTTTVKPFSVLQQLALEQQQQQQQQHSVQSNVTAFHILQALDKDLALHDSKTTTLRPFRVLQQLDQDLAEAHSHTTTMKPFRIVSALIEDAVKKHQHYLEGSSAVQAQHKDLVKNQAKDVPQAQGRAKQSQKRRRKRIRRRRKRIRRRRKRTRRRRRKKRKKRRKKRKKKKHKGDKGDKKKKRKKKGKRKKRKRKKEKQKPEPTHSPLTLFQPAQLIFANPTKQPHYYPHGHDHHGYPSYPSQSSSSSSSLTVPSALLASLSTAKPSTTTTQRPFSKIKDLLRHNNLFKKKKKEYLSHVGQVLYPFVKFVAFFTVLNPFTLGVFLFTLVSPAVFGFLGFVALSVLVKPFLNLVFGVKQNVDAFDRKRFLANKRAERLKLGLRPVTIHKHYYQQKPVHSAPPLRLRPVGGHWRRQSDNTQATPTAPLSPPRGAPKGQMKHYNPLLPDQRKALDMDYDDV
ncbi:uncharacterized protein LOC117589282 [Drosophila guanche]|uniref:Uncharacterized protein n=1 Tax=Drosophila guanche TaxID=7266 RepID=A0A3B0JZ18_DROGU|nr:uncharacterized protein LOC117589282 [Drosophila guanche]SPP87294.1 Hypothetical predicted protein [Drosophila guanche]